MDTKEIVIIVESVLLVVLLIVLFAVIVMRGGQFWPLSSKRTNGDQASAIMARSRMVQTLNDAEAIRNGQPTQKQRAEMMSDGLAAGYYKNGPGGTPIHQYDDLVWDRNTRQFVTRSGYPKLTDSAYTE